MVKFKIGFVVPAETLFGLMAKFLPVEDLHVEELVEKPTPSESFLKGVEIAKTFEKKLRAPVRRRKKRAPNMDLTSGINAIVMSVLKDGLPHRATEMEPLMSASGFSANSVSSRLQALKKRGMVTQPGVGLWQLVETAHSEQKAAE